MREEPWPKSAILGGVVAALSAAVALSFAGLGYGFFSLGVLLASLSSYFCPTHYLLDEEGVQVRHLGHRRQRSWRQFCRIDRCRQGVFLSPFARPSRLDPFRGCLLRTPRDPEAVCHFAQRHIGPATL